MFPAPVDVILDTDTDIGTDIDDALALALLHALESRGECRLLAVTITKDHPLAAAFTDAVNGFYGRGDVPIGVVRGRQTPDEGKYLAAAKKQDGSSQRYPHDLAGGGAAADAIPLLRRTLAGRPDGSVVIVQVGFSTNLAGLLDSPADASSPLPGRNLMARKERLLSVMGGAFQPIDGQPGYREYNIVTDLPAARKLTAEWPTPIEDRMAAEAVAWMETVKDEPSGLPRQLGSRTGHRLLRPSRGAAGGHHGRRRPRPPQRRQQKPDGRISS